MGVPIPFGPETAKKDIAETEDDRLEWWLKRKLLTAPGLRFLRPVIDSSVEIRIVFTPFDENSAP